ncbi:MAG: amidohydrolase/deacetylase family metallohydrolase [Proteobacteria bacterium]|nr:amidohydrolase/deacetylase family metallohydrolase [Pseudomonadota bacterium]
MATWTIRGGTVIDSEEGPWVVRDLHIGAEPGGQEVDATGCYVAPGFIDLHTHVFSHSLFTHSRLQADRIGVRQGVACVVDAGSSGAITIDAFPDNVHGTQATKVFAFINIGSPGLPTLGGGHASRPELCDLAATVKSFERHADWIVGVKVLASSSHTGSFGLEAVKLARKAAELVGKPLMLHVGNAPPLIDDVLDLLRPGDIVTHTYHGKTGGVLGYADRIIEPFKRAVDRGVVVDLGHGRSSFSFRVFEIALDQGMPITTISSDLHRGNVDSHVFSLARTMTKLRTFGFSLGEVVEKVTTAPARAIGIDRHGFGSLTGGTLTIFRELDKQVDLMDAEGVVRRTKTWIEPVGVLVDGHYHKVCETI